MVRIRERLLTGRSDEGLSLVEVLVALMVFTIIALGVGYSTITILRMTGDIRSRQVATNLATSELDLARAAADPFDVLNGTRTTLVGNSTFTVTRSTSWVETSGADIGCGSGTGLLKAKRVNVTVTWNGMLSTTKPVRSDTLISPDDRINDPSLGTIRLSVLNAAGTGSSGVDVAIAAVSDGAKALASQPDDTDTDGCSYALKVVPGVYKVTISRGSSVSTDQVAAPFANVTVTAGGSVATQFQYDYAATFNLGYASNYAGATPKLPDNLDTSYLSSYGVYVDSGRKSQISLYPSPSGYSGVAGKYVAPSTSAPAGCVNVDPAAWPAATVNGVALAAGARTPAVGAAPRGQTAMSVPMGVMTVKYTGAATLTAKSATGASDPGCGVPMTYSFGSVLVNGTITIALPFGSWNLYAAGSSTPIAGANIVPLSGGRVSGTVVTLDPRSPN